jgi:hypothetical protein
MKCLLLLVILFSWAGSAWSQLQPPRCDLPAAPTENVSVYVLGNKGDGRRGLVHLDSDSAQHFVSLNSINWVFVYIPCASSSVKTGVVVVRTTKDTCSKRSYDINRLKLYRSGVFYKNCWPTPAEFSESVKYNNYVQYFSNGEEGAGSDEDNLVLSRFHGCYSNTVQSCLRDPALRIRLFAYEEQAGTKAKMTSMYRFACSGGTWVPFWFGADPVASMRSVELAVNVILGDELLSTFQGILIPTATPNCP